MTPQAGDRLMSLTDVSEMLGIPVHTLYRWRYKGDGPVGYRVGRHVRYRGRPSKRGWSNRSISASTRRRSVRIQSLRTAEPNRSGWKDLRAPQLPRSPASSSPCQSPDPATSCMPMSVDSRSRV
jgi:predicted DNA-binding transcriptional regulator AlpA